MGPSDFVGAADAPTPGVLVRIAGSGTDDGDRLGVTPALAAGNTCAFGSLAMSIMACASMDRSHPESDGASADAPLPIEVGSVLEIGATTGEEPPVAGFEADDVKPDVGGRSLVLMVAIDLDTFESA
jgi:hypothetical protein